MRLLILLRNICNLSRLLILLWKERLILLGRERFHLVNRFLHRFVVVIIIFVIVNLVNNKRAFRVQNLKSLLKAIPFEQPSFPS